MAFYILNIKHFPFPKFLSLFYLLMITNFFSVTSVNFSLPNFSYESDIKLDRAFIEDQEIKLTGNKKQVKTDIVGRATYSSPMHLWDKASGNLTDFTTHFSFVIDSQKNTNYGDGLAFFLAREGSWIIPDNSSGGAMGLARVDQLLNSTDNPFVAVEFDIYPNKLWDPPGRWPGLHLGIDINSLNSSATESWDGEWANTSITQGLTNEAQISYNSTSHNLSVLLTGRRNNTIVEQSLSYIVDLRDYLPERVTFGFSAATGSSPAMHNICTWNFSSTLKDIVANPTVDGSPSPNPAPNPRKNNRFGLAVGLDVGGSFLFGGLALILFCFWKRNRSHTEEDLALDSCMDEEFQRGTGPKRFSFKELAHATNNFDDEEKLGQGGFVGFYRGFLRDSNSFVAVKRVSKGSKQGIKEYASEVKIISRLRHKNLVQLIGWCHESGELLLVYEFLPNGSLDSHLFTQGSMGDDTNSTCGGLGVVGIDYNGTGKPIFNN
jgi:hypothetical protein